MESFSPMALDETFSFSCSVTVPCFNNCCQDLNQFLTPYDILRLKKHLNLNSGEFLEQYTRVHTGPETGLPVVTLKALPGPLKKCPFVTEKGCKVYENRPSSCRIYPLARMLSRNRETGQLKEQYMMICEDHCLGFEHGNQVSVRDWIENQGIAVYNEMNDLMMELIRLKNQSKPGPLDIKTSHLFYMACYDLDRFREQVANGLLEGLTLTAELIDQILSDETELLIAGLTWLKTTVLGVRS